MSLGSRGTGGRGLALRFPRFLSIREDKNVEDATNPDHVLSLFHKQSNRSAPTPQASATGPVCSDDDQDDATTSDTSIPSYASDEPKVTMDQLAEKLQNMGYTPLDFLTIYMNWYMDGEMKREDQTRQSQEFLLDFIHNIDAVVEGRISLAHRDQRSYAQVLAANQK
jgi:hypothetical protein